MLSVVGTPDVAVTGGATRGVGVAKHSAVRPAVNELECKRPARRAAAANAHAKPHKESESSEGERREAIGDPETVIPAVRRQVTKSAPQETLGGRHCAAAAR